MLLLFTVVSHYSMAPLCRKVEVLRTGQGFVSVPSHRLVPGDMIRLRPGTLPCDIVLLLGECIVDENMLTGESVPVSNRHSNLNPRQPIYYTC